MILVFAASLIKYLGDFPQAPQGWVLPHSALQRRPEGTLLVAGQSRLGTCNNRVSSPTALCIRAIPSKGTDVRLEQAEG